MNLFNIVANKKYLEKYFEQNDKTKLFCFHVAIFVNLMDNLYIGKKLILGNCLEQIKASQSPITLWNLQINNPKRP